MRTAGPLLVFDGLGGIGWLAHCFTTRAFEESPPPAGRNMEALARRLRDARFPSARAVVWGEQVHGRGVAVAGASAEGFAEAPGADAVATAVPGVLLLARGADCPVVFIADLRRRAVALVHSGRRGTGMRAASAVLAAMGDSFGTVPADCRAAIGPSIGPCCYPADLWGMLEEELRGLGVAAVENPRLCTACRPDLFFSHRRDRGAPGRMLAAAMLKDVLCNSLEHNRI
ncbi:MAG: polyphenol oxidase family protein [bacterium]|nr:polyphenol oxidase family protein [bacterium]